MYDSSFKNFFRIFIFLILIIIFIPTIIWFTYDKEKYISSNGSGYNCTLISFLYENKQFNLFYIRENCVQIMKESFQDFDFTPLNSTIPCYSDKTTRLDYYYLKNKTKWEFESFVGLICFGITYSISALIYIFFYVYNNSSNLLKYKNKVINI